MPRCKAQRTASSMSNDPEYHLRCAVAYRNYEENDSKASQTKTLCKTSAEMKEQLMRVLWIEASEQMKQPLRETPQDTFLHPIDIDTDAPGIVTARVSKLTEGAILRKQAPLESVVYTPRAPPRDATPPEFVLDSERSLADAIVLARKQAMRALAAERRSLCNKEKRERESLDERAERLATAKEKRNERKEKRKELQARDERADGSAGEGANASSEPSEGEGRGGGVALPTVDDETPPAEAPPVAPVVPSIGDVLEVYEGQIDMAVTDILQCANEDSEAADARVGSDTARVEGNGSVFDTPIVHDRHMRALTAAQPRRELADALLGVDGPSPSLGLIDGPPGTGKTQRLVEVLSEPALRGMRVFACAVTNIGAVNLYTRILNAGYAAETSLVMAPSRVPPDTPIVSQDPRARIVCGTVSARSGAILHNQQFDVILLDEAAQCMEAWFWGLLRDDVQRVVMGGDTRQLPALVSERGRTLGHHVSAMERLETSHQYPTTRLTTQRRMHPEIASFPNRQFYDAVLHTDYTAPPEPPQCDVPPYRLLHVLDGSCQPVGTSYENAIEASVCVKEALSMAAVFPDTVILTPYQAQRRRLITLLPASAKICVHTIDSFQGREADAVLVSIVRDTKLGFWQDARRLNVALTRARHALRVVGVAASWTSHLAALRDDAQGRDAVDEVSSSCATLT